MTNKIHEGRNVKRFREMLGIKQEALAFDLGGDWNQKKVSLLEQKKTIEPAILEQIAHVLKVPTEAIRNFDEEQAINIISNNTFENCNQPIAGTGNYNDCTFNPLDKVMELFERLLSSEREKVELMKEILGKLK